MEKGIQIQAEREDSKIDAINHEDIVTLDIQHWEVALDDRKTGGSFKAKLTPFRRLDHNFKGAIEVHFSTESDYIIFEEMCDKVCLIFNPSLMEEY